MSARTDLTHPKTVFWPVWGWVGIAALCGLVVAYAGPLVVPVVAAAVLMTMVAVHPPLAAYIVIGTTPFLVGLNRGAAIPFLRPNEALLLVVGGGLVLRRLVLIMAGQPFRLTVRPVDASILALCVTGSVFPFLWMAARGLEFTVDDLLYGFALWKYFAIFVIIGTSIKTGEQVAQCLRLSMVIAAVIAVVGILQALRLFGVPRLLATHYVQEHLTAAKLENRRSSATLGASLAMADVMIFNLAIAAGWLSRLGRSRILLGGMFLFGLGCVAAGQVSGLLALVAAVIAVGRITGRLRHALKALFLFLLVAGLLLSPVIMARIDRIDPQTGQPESWLGRRRNLEQHILPEFSSATNILFGVRLAARVPAPETVQDRWIYIESGHLWLLWTGGVPMLAAFFVFLGTSLRTTAQIARRRTGPIAVAATASFAAMTALAVGTIFDPHLTFRGTADLNFSLLALALVSARPADVHEALTPSLAGTHFKTWRRKNA